jgi:hypothetical protein
MMVAYRNGDLVNMLNFCTAKCCFVLWYNVGIHMLTLTDRDFKGYFLIHVYTFFCSEKNNKNVIQFLTSSFVIQDFTFTFFSSRFL